MARLRRGAGGGHRLGDSPDRGTSRAEYGRSPRGAGPGRGPSAARGRRALRAGPRPRAHLPEDDALPELGDRPLLSLGIHHAGGRRARLPRRPALRDGETARARPARAPLALRDAPAAVSGGAHGARVTRPANVTRAVDREAE